MGITRAELARRISTLTDPVTRMAISNLLDDKTVQSRLVPRIHAALGWLPPMSPEDAAMASIGGYADLGAAGQATVRAVIDTLRAVEQDGADPTPRKTRR